ncbi:MAG: hypothetical protein KDD02_16450 [Phaeodactylibacter sp.]|nr:hypothetical protein [Phaeodactylibacter sp.]MCB9304169.1 hypothetical protein [Lewinellaceae bacterium]
MGNNYNIKFNPRLPSKEEIARHKDFGALLEQYQSYRQKEPRNRLRSLRLAYIGGAVAAAVAAVLIVLGGVFSTPKSSALTAEQYFAQRACVQPPLPEQATVSYSSFRVNVNQGGVYEYPSGSRLVVPAAAFANDYGQLIEGEVDIYYREMHDFVDIFLSGVPLSYDSAGVQYQLELAGMVEIFAEQNGQRIQLAPGKTIDVELASEIIVPRLNMESPPAYNIYQLDTFSRTWIYQDVDRLQLVEDDILDVNEPLFPLKQRLSKRLNEIKADAKTALAAIESSVPKPVEPLRPQRADGNLPTLELDFLDGSITVEDTENGDVRNELAKLQRMYDGVIWQISPNSPAFDERAFNVKWESVKIRPVNSRDYELTLIHPQNQVTLVVSPVLTGADYERALARYQSELEAYQTALASREAKLKEQKEALQVEVEQRKKEAYAAYDKELSGLKTDGLEFGKATQYLARRKVINRFKATAFGIWNCARPILPPEEQIEASFKDQYGNSYRNQPVYLADKSQNTIYRFLATEDMPLHFDKNSDNLLWIVTPDHKIAILSPESLREASRKKGDYTLQLNLVDKTIRSEKEIRAILHF